MSQSWEDRIPDLGAGDSQVWGLQHQLAVEGMSPMVRRRVWSLQTCSPYTCFFSIYSSGCVANLPRRAPYPWLQNNLKGKRDSKLLGDSTSTLSAELEGGAGVLWLGEGGWKWVSARRKGVSVQGLPEVEYVPGGFGGRTPLSVRRCTNPQSPGSELVELHGATVIQTVNKICG